MNEIVTLTMNPSLDKTSSASKVLPEEKIRCGDPSFEPGGGGINVSRAISKLEGRSKAVFPAGGPQGERLVQLLQEEEIKIRDVNINDQTRDNLTVFDEASNNQYRFVMPGPKISESELEKLSGILKTLSREEGFLVISGSLPHSVSRDYYRKIIESVREVNKGTKVILDTTGGPLKEALQAGVFLIKPNYGEFVNLAGKKLSEDPDQIKFGRKLISEGKCKAIVLSLGAGGALLITKEIAQHFRSPTVPIVSKVGAGDSMVAGIVLGLARDYELKKAVRFGVAAGASAVMTPGTELCKKESTFRLFGRITDSESG